MRAIGWGSGASRRGVDTAFSRACDAAMRATAMFKGAGDRDRIGGAGPPVPFPSECALLFPLREGFPVRREQLRVGESAGAEVAGFARRRRGERIPCAGEKVLDGLRENRYEEAGTRPEVVLVAPGPRGCRRRDDTSRDFHVPIREAFRKGGGSGLSDREKIFLTHLSSCAG